MGTLPHGPAKVGRTLQRMAGQRMTSWGSGDEATNYAYPVRPVVARGVAGADLDRAGEFEFGLVPGQCKEGSIKRT